jgi:hypothetical protein
LAATEGRHAEALRGFEWFHQNALKHEPGLYGVRLSFALSYWVDLGKVYPKALRSLVRVQRQKTAALRKGGGNRDLFHDVAAINRTMKKDLDTYRLFRWLATKRPKLAKRCARVALPSIVKARDFDLASRYIDPESRVQKYAEFMNKELQKIPEYKRRTGSKAPMRWAYIANYSDDAALLIRILRGVGERARAARLRQSAVDLLDSRAARRQVAERLGT